MTLSRYLVIFAMVFTATIANICLKLGMNILGKIEFGRIWTDLPKIVLNPYILFGIVALSISAFLWLQLLSELDLSYAYPILVSLTICSTTLVSWIILNEKISFLRLLGIAVVCIGIFIVSKTG